MQTVGFQSQAHEEDERIHESVHCNQWGDLNDLSVQLLARADTISISRNYIYLFLRTIAFGSACTNQPILITISITKYLNT